MKFLLIILLFLAGCEPVATATTGDRYTPDTTIADPADGPGAWFVLDEGIPFQFTDSATGDVLYEHFSPEGDDTVFVTITETFYLNQQRDGETHSDKIKNAFSGLIYEWTRRGWQYKSVIPEEGL